MTNEQSTRRLFLTDRIHWKERVACPGGRKLFVLLIIQAHFLVKHFNLDESRSFPVLGQ